MLNGKRLKIIGLSDKDDLERYPDYFKQGNERPVSYIHFDVSDESLKKMREAGELSLLFSALFYKLRGALDYKGNLESVQRGLDAILELLKAESDNLYDDLGYYRDELEFIYEYEKRDLKEDIKKVVVEHLEKVTEVRDGARPPDPFDVDLEKIDLNGDLVIAIEQLEMMLNEYQGLMSMSRGTTSNYSYRIKYNTLLNALGSCYEDLAKKPENIKQKQELMQKAEVYYGSVLL